jgi:LuxR family maltose regulon positive regulatory protein
LAAFPSRTTSINDTELQLIDPLSDRELELLGLIANGMSNRDVAEELVLTVGTVKWHLSNIYSKLDVSSRTQAVARARELQLL